METSFLFFTYKLALCVCCCFLFKPLPPRLTSALVGQMLLFVINKLLAMAHLLWKWLGEYRPHYVTRSQAISRFRSLDGLRYQTLPLSVKTFNQEYETLKIQTKQNCPTERKLRNDRSVVPVPNISGSCEIVWLTVWKPDAAVSYGYITATRALGGSQVGSTGRGQWFDCVIRLPHFRQKHFIVLSCTYRKTSVSC